MAIRHSKSKTKKLEMPSLGLGTWELKSKECTDVVSLALQLGYRHIDTAASYSNHKAIGKAIADFNRSEIFLTSKIPLEKVNPARVLTSVEAMCDKALKELSTEYLDLYLIHWPHPALSMTEVVEAMQHCMKKGKILHVGVSNFTIHHLEDLRQDNCHPAANQVEFHPYLYQKELLDYCASHDIQLIAYRPLGKKKLLKEPLFIRIGEKYKKTGAQVILRWLVQKGISVVVKASSKQHLADNLAIFDFSLSKDEMQTLDGLNQNKRFCCKNDPAFNY